MLEVSGHSVWHFVEHADRGFAGYSGFLSSFIGYWSISKLKITMILNSVKVGG